MTEEISNITQQIKGIIRDGNSDRVDSADEYTALSMFIDENYTKMTDDEMDYALGLQVEYEETLKNNDDTPIEEDNDEVVDVEIDEEESVDTEADEKAKKKINPPATPSNFDANDAGKDVEFLLTHWTDEDNANVINTHLKNINSDNVLEFLQGYYEKDANPTEGLIEHLDDDASSEVTMESKMKLVNSILKKAKELGLEDDDSYKEIVKIKTLYEKTYKSETTFNKQYRRASYWDHKGKWGSILGGAGVGAAAGAGIGLLIGGPIGAGIGAIVGGAAGWFIGLADVDTDNEKLDDAIQDLYQKMMEESGLSTEEDVEETEDEDAE